MNLISHRTEDPDSLAEALHPIVGQVRARPTQKQGFVAELRAGALPRAGVFHLRIAHSQLVIADERPFVGVTVPISGVFEVCDRTRLTAFHSGTAHLLRPAPVFDVRSAGDRDIQALTLAMDTSLLESHLRAFGGDSEEPLPLPPQLSTTTAAGASFLRYLRFLWRELQRDDSLLRVPRVAREAEETLAAMLTESIGMTSPQPMQHDNGGHAAVLRNAEEFLDAHLDRPVSLAEVAAAVGAGTKTLLRAFHKRHGLGPIGFRRRRRLEAARRDLAAAEPGSTTVTEIAIRYGFEHLGRFAGTYRNAFGELPSETLGH